MKLEPVVQDLRLERDRARPSSRHWPVILSALPSFLSTASASATGLDERINAAFAPPAAFLSRIVFFSVEITGAELPLIVVWWIGGALFFTLYFASSTCVAWRTPFA